MAPRGSAKRGTGRGAGRGSSVSTASTRQQPKRTGAPTGSTSSSRAQSAAPSKSTAPPRSQHPRERTSESNSPPPRPNVSSASGLSGGSTRGRGLNKSSRTNAFESGEEDDTSNQQNPGRFGDYSDNDDEGDLGLSQALVRSRREDTTREEVSRARLELEDRLRRADEQSQRIQRDLEEQQDQNLTLRQELAKRRLEEATEGEPQAKRAKTSREAPKNDYAKAFEQGKQMAALYCPFGTRRLIFGVLQQVLGGAQSIEGGEENEGTIEEEEEEEERNGDTFEQQMDDPKAASSNKSTAEGTYDFFQRADQTAYIEDSARLFWQDVPMEDVEGWQTRAYQRRFMDGMSRGRSSFKHGTEQAELVFGFQVTQKNFAKKSTRSELPEVASLLENSMFKLEGEEDVRYRVYRHGCLSQILMRVFHGPSALASGKKSKKARSTYQEQWGVMSISIELLAWTATVATHILSGEEELNQAEAIRNVFWKQLHFLTQIKDRGGEPYVDLIRGYDAKLGLLPADSRGNLIKPAEAALLAQLLE